LLFFLDSLFKIHHLLPILTPFSDNRPFSFQNYYKRFQ
jgi:hypothetical protein